MPTKTPYNALAASLDTCKWRFDRYMIELRQRLINGVPVHPDMLSCEESPEEAVVSCLDLGQALLLKINETYLTK